MKIFKYYKYNPKSLKYELVDLNLYFGLISLLCCILVITGFYIGVNNTSKPKITPEEKLIIIKEHNRFSEEKLINKLKELNINFPHIILAQAKLETGGFTSKVFKEGNNLFGMKQAKIRATTSKGTENNHAYYDSWEQSVYDYALYSCRYLSMLTNEEQYFQYLEQSYAEDPGYVGKLKNLIQKEQLKLKF